MKMRDPVAIIHIGVHLPAPNPFLLGPPVPTHKHYVASPTLQTQGGRRESRIQRGSFSSWLEKLDSFPPTFKAALQNLLLFFQPACLLRRLSWRARGCSQKPAVTHCGASVYPLLSSAYRAPLSLAKVRPKGL